MKGSFKNFQACVEHICIQLGVSPHDGQVEHAAGLLIRMKKDEMSSTRDGAVEVLSELKLRGHKTGLISNCSMEAAHVWPETILAPFMDAAVLSALEGMKKPDRRDFQAAVNRMAVSPDKCLYIADGMDLELSAAKEVGMEPVILRVPGENDYDQFREEWRGREIKSLGEVMEILDL
jgi:putative hydrolase of the HAD superfamily